MKTKSRKKTSPLLPDPASAPTYAEISAEAEVLWRQRGCPGGVDQEIWLEAENQLRLVSQKAKADLERAALSEPLSRLDHKSDDVMGELEQLFPGSAAGASTSV